MDIRYEGRRAGAAGRQLAVPAEISGRRCCYCQQHFSLVKPVTALNKLSVTDRTIQFVVVTARTVPFLLALCNRHGDVSVYLCLYLSACCALPWTNILLVSLCIFAVVCFVAFGNAAVRSWCRFWCAVIDPPVLRRQCRMYDVESLRSLQLKARFWAANRACLIGVLCKHCSHVTGIPKADWPGVKNKQLTATPC